MGKVMRLVLWRAEWLNTRISVKMAAAALLCVLCLASAAAEDKIGGELRAWAKTQGAQVNPSGMMCVLVHEWSCSIHSSMQMFMKDQ